MKISVIGGNGFVGSNIVEVFSNYNHEIYSFSRRNQFDLLTMNCSEFATRTIADSDFIIHCAADVGSLNYATDYAADIIRNNALIDLNLYYILERIKIKGIIINPIANCAYPGNKDVYNEQEFWDGNVHKSVLSYGTSKRFLYTVSQCYNMQYKMKSINLFVPNMYGKYDSTDPNKTHAFNALISKFVKSKNENSMINIWGSGNPVREWLFVKDFANILLYMLNEIYMGADLNEFQDVNISSGNTLSVKTIVRILSKKLNYTNYQYDTSKQDGVPYKIMNTDKFKEKFPSFKFIDFDQSLDETINYYKSIYPY